MLSVILSFIKGVPIKVWLYLALILAYPACYLYGHHKGYVEGKDRCVADYVEQGQKEAEKKQKDDAENKQKAVDQESDLSKQLAQVDSEKNDLKKKLNDALTKKPTATAGCPVVDPNDLRLLSSDISKANQS